MQRMGVRTLPGVLGPLKSAKKADHHVKSDDGSRDQSEVLGENLKAEWGSNQTQQRIDFREGSG